MRIEVRPIRSLLDEPVVIRIVSGPVNQLVTIDARMWDHDGQQWTSNATFLVDADGGVDLDRQSPASGTYTGVDPMGLFWSMTIGPEAISDHAPAPSPVAPLTVHLDARINRATISTATIERCYVSDDVDVSNVDERGLVGMFFQQPGLGARPAVLVLGGSEGGLPAAAAALIASHGYAALALAYFGLPTLPPALAGIPLEYFETALAWLGTQNGIRSDAIAVLGGSRGGELALLLGASFPQIRAVVAYVPSHVVHAGVGGGTGTGTHPSWTRRGTPVPFVPFPPRRANGPGHGPAGEQSVALTPRFLEALSDETIVEKATIPVERIKGPVLLISGEDDQMWPSAMMADRVMERLAANNHPYHSVHLPYAGVGHTIGIPTGPTTMTTARHSVVGRLFALGGNARDIAIAQADAWAQVQYFLRENLS